MPLGRWVRFPEAQRTRKERPPPVIGRGSCVKGLSGARIATVVEAVGVERAPSISICEPAVTVFASPTRLKTLGATMPAIGDDDDADEDFDKREARACDAVLRSTQCCACGGKAKTEVLRREGVRRVTDRATSRRARAATLRPGYGHRTASHCGNVTFLKPHEIPHHKKPVIDTPVSRLLSSGHLRSVDLIDSIIIATRDYFRAVGAPPKPDERRVKFRRSDIGAVQANIPPHFFH